MGIALKVYTFSYLAQGIFSSEFDLHLFHALFLQLVIMNLTRADLMHKAVGTAVPMSLLQVAFQRSTMIYTLDFSPQCPATTECSSLKDKEF